MTKRLLRRPEVESTTGLPRSTIYRMMAANTFPKPINLGGRLVGWKESDIQKWIDDRIKATEQTS